MPNKFISNYELIKLLEKATSDELLALTKIFNSSTQKPYSARELEEKISKEGGHGVMNYFRGHGTGYLDILDDVASALKIENMPSYNSEVQYFDEIFYIKNEKDDKDDSKTKRLYDKNDATILGLEYAAETEQKIIVELIKKSYELMLKQKDDAEKKLLKLEKNVDITLLDIKHSKSSKKQLSSKIEMEKDSETYKSLQKQLQKLNRSIERNVEKERELKQQIKEIKKNIEETEKRIEDFDNTMNDVAEQFGSKNFGALTGTAGIMVLANLGGFATYTFLTSMMSVVSMGTLGFGAYTAATSLLSIMIGPVGWAGLGIFAIFSLGKPNMSKLMPVVATIGAIRQRLKYEET